MEIIELRDSTKCEGGRERLRNIGRERLADEDDMKELSWVQRNDRGSQTGETA